MKQSNNLSRRSVSASLTILALTLVFSAAARAQTPTIKPVVDCTTYNEASGTLYVYWGYVSNDTYNAKLLPGTLANYFTPNEPYQGQPTYYYPGEHHGVFITEFYPSDQGSMVWVLQGTNPGDGNRATADINSPRCGTGTITYQGRLTSAGAQASGNYDLQFRLYNRATGGAAIGALATAANTPVSNGIFTVPLEFGAEALVTPAKLYLEIGVRPAGSSGAYTTLTPRQLLTSAPSAVFAHRAAVAADAEKLNGLFAQDYVTKDSGNFIQNTTYPQSANFSVTGSGVIGRKLTVGGNGTGTAFIGDLFGAGNYTGITLNNSKSQTDYNFLSSPTDKALYLNRPDGNSIVFRKNNQTQMTLDTNGILTVNSSIATNKISVTGGVLARGGAPGASGGNNNGYAFSGSSGDNDSGLFSEANGQVSLYTNAGERIRVTDSGATVTGNLTVSGAISGATKNFKIDHPLDPSNKTLTYTSIESPDMMNIYNGNTTTDASGEAVVQMPAYFEALNKDFRYQLSVIGQFAQAIVAEEVKGNAFKIKTDKPNVKVSWQVTGIRHDKFAEENRPQVEQEKPVADKGKCLSAPTCRR